MLRNQSCLVSSPRWHYWNSKIAFGFHDAAYRFSDNTNMKPGTCATNSRCKLAEQKHDSLHASSAANKEELD